jgi:hypothetical protein
MRTRLCFLLTSVLAAQDPSPIQDLSLDLRTDLGSEPSERIQLAPRGCWDGLTLRVSQRPVSKPDRRAGEATVEVWDLLPPTSPRHEAFDFFLVSLRDRLSKALAQPPPKNQAIELREIMASDPSNPQELNLTNVKSMQERFNRLPPNGSPVQ